ncbi:MAG: alpha-amylase family glycosyl hydrolase [Treponema sp.]|nr:alpha-amylase family glycosyl hydrolase [Treponema sp.]
MKKSYNEFHISKKIRDLCKFEESLYASSGNVIFANLSSVRTFQLSFNNYFEQRGEENKKVSAGQLNAMGLLDEIFHFVTMLYRKNQQADILQQMLSELDKSIGKEKTDQLLLDFMAEFPPTEVYKGNISAEEYLTETAIDEGTGLERSNREQTLEELILLHLANENPAFKPFSVLFDDSILCENSNYSKSWAVIQAVAKENPSFGPFDHDLITLLREPVLFSPESLKGQLEYIEKHWGKYVGELLVKRILTGMDTISEEEKASWAPMGGDGPELMPYSYENLMNEYERFSADSEWMPNVILMAKTVLVWLDQLTKQYGYTIDTLDKIPDAELDKLRDEGFTGLWLIGLWERSKASRRIKQICGNPEAAASAYSLFDYNIAQNIGGWDAVANLRQRCWQRGIRLASDMVPNHTGMDGDWVMNRPDLFVQRKDCPFPHYTFNGENLSQDPRTSVYLEDHYYSKNDCSVVFKRVDNQTGDVRYIYHGNDGTGLPWNDTAQLDFLNPETREAVMQEILHVAQNFPIIRFDAAMVLAKKSIRRLWYPEPGHGGDIATRSETGLSTQQFNDAIPNEFWREVVDRVAVECPDTLLLAEAFWMMEGYFVRTLGMHRVYNSAFMNMLKKEENQKYRDTIKNTINFDPQILKRYVNFMNNPDEETAIAQFGDGDKYFGCCTLMITMPGLPMFGHGQIEGYTEKYGMEYTKAYKNETPNNYLVDRHWQDIFPLMKKRYLFSGVENFLLYDLWQDGHVNENVFAYSNGAGSERTLVFYNNKYDQAYGWIKQSDPYAVKTGNGDEISLVTRSISEGLNLTAEDDKYCIFRENRSGLWFIRKSSEICEKGMFVMLNGFEYQVYMDIHQVTDEADNRYKILCEFLNGKGCEDIETAWQELIYADLYKAADTFAEKVFTPLSSCLQEEKKISAKIVKAILDDSKDSALDFYEIALKTAKEETGGSKIKTQDCYKKFAERFKKYIAVHNAAAPKKPADLQKALVKAKTAESYAKLLCTENKDLETAILAWSCVSVLAENGMACKWNLGRKFSQYVKEYKISENTVRPLFTKLFLLATATDSSSISTAKGAKDAAYKIVDLLCNSKYCGLLSGANCFDNIWWFNKETIEESLTLITMIMGLGAKAKDLPAVFMLSKTVNKAKLEAAYKCELLVKKFAPKVVKTKAKAKTNAKTKSATKTKATTKKTSASKTKK